MFKVLAILLAGLTATSAAAAPERPQHPVNVFEMGGGRLAAFARRAERQWTLGRDVRISVPVCASSCTLYLSKERSCVAPNTLFMFHGPSSGWSVVTMALAAIPVKMTDAEKEKFHRELMRDWYNKHVPGLGNWFVRSGAVYKWGYGFIRVRGSELHRAFGVPLCKEN
ncbi:hypothetical protein HOR19_gp15 [Phage MedPE-SWcel-C56]|uniref:Uncharacterized protein n=1 Tax=Phage MedPE-SWcel-C56 TaxID=1871314 RepID=A0A1B1IY04_9CAUD|nr:hypothetical protein HOR19_gp15 [Phage MedPE-SWcel-C56]ANS06208.1 hypothetical protein [Phage MedPE-SWcel-C56]